MVGVGSRSAFGALVALGVVAACGRTNPTSITLDVRTDLGCDDLKTVSIAIAEPSEIDGKPAQTVTSACSPRDVGVSAVGTLVVVPSGANDAEIGIRVVGGVTRIADRCTAESGFDGCIVARRLVRFVPESDVRLTIDLRRECADRACDAASTCVEGACAPAALDTGLCIAEPCGEEALGARAPSADGGVLDAGGDGTTDEPSPPCAPDEKVCGAACVKSSDPAFGCTTGGCSPCPGSDGTLFSCKDERCERTDCRAGFKLCGDTCVPADAAHGCANETCTPCPSANGKAGCAAGSCTLECAQGFKACGGLCVRVDDPTYGCTDAGCTAKNCPDPGAGTLVCNGASCEVGPCPDGTKSCNQRCVPADANNGCQSGSCAACGPGQVCGGSPTACQCVPEPLSVTCASKACGPATNNCGQSVTCPDTCPQAGPQWSCNAGGVGANACGCTPLTDTMACGDMRCGSVSDGCGGKVRCGSCSGTLVCKCGGMCLGSNSLCP